MVSFPEKNHQILKKPPHIHKIQKYCNFIIFFKKSDCGWLINLPRAFGRCHYINKLCSKRVKKALLVAPSIRIISDSVFLILNSLLLQSNRNDGKEIQDLSASIYELFI